MFTCGAASYYTLANTLQLAFSMEYVDYALMCSLKHKSWRHNSKHAMSSVMNILTIIREYNVSLTQELVPLCADQSETVMDLSWISNQSVMGQKPISGRP